MCQRNINTSIRMNYFLFTCLLVSLCQLWHVQGEVSDDLPIVECITTKGVLAIEVHRDWSPLGADRFIELVQDNFYTNIALFRCVHKFLVQFGISEDPTKRHWHNKNIKDDPNLNMGIKKNYVSFAGGGPNTRSTQLFIAFEDLDFLGKEPWETPFGVVISGEQTLSDFYKGYGDIPPFGTGPDQQMIHREGNAYIHRLYPKTDFIKECRVVDTSKGHNTGDMFDIPDIISPESDFSHNIVIGDFIQRAQESQQLRGINADSMELSEAEADKEINVHSSEHIEEHEIHQAIGFSLVLMIVLLVAVIVIFRYCTKPTNSIKQH